MADEFADQTSGAGIGTLLAVNRGFSGCFDGPGGGVGRGHFALNFNDEWLRFRAVKVNLAEKQLVRLRSLHFDYEGCRPAGRNVFVRHLEEFAPGIQSNPSDLP